MQSFEKEILQKHTPCIFKSRDRIIEALPEVHAEILLTHPFREGNGRMARVLATLMALQAGLPLLDFRSIQGKKTSSYITAIHAATGSNYEPMENIFRQILKDSARS
jgi:cell filamentation protein